MKKTKQLISIALALLMLVGVIVIAPISANAALNPQTVVDLALSKVGSSYANGYCLAFVKDMFNQAYGFTSTACCAYKYGSTYLDSSDRNNIPIGADVFFGGSSVWCSESGTYAGHIGIYVGDDCIVHAWDGKIVKTSINYVINCGYPYRGWGWHGNQDFVTPVIDVTTPTISFNKSSYTIGETANITWTASPSGSSFKHYWLVITNTTTGKQFYGTATGADGDVSKNYYNLALTEAGTYKVEVYAVNQSGGGKSDIKNFCVDPKYSDIISTLTAKENFNGHTYELYTASTTWKTAYKTCEKLGGHLVTINSKEENDFVLSLSKKQSVSNDVWIGGSDFAKEGKWYWINSEPFTYTNWKTSTNEPNNSDGIEHYAQLYKDGYWNDAPNDNAKNKTVFVCEYDEINTSGYEPSFEEIYNGHKYEYYDYSVDWQTAKAICEAKGGHLVTIENTYENSRIKGNLSKLGKQVWIGYTDIASEGTWKDVLGNSFFFNKWDTTNKEPNNTNGIEDFAHMNMDGLWNDVPRFASMYVSMGFVCEYDYEMENYIPVVSESTNGHRYELYNISITWNQAYKTCEKLGGHLVTINSKEENEFVLNLAKSQSISSDIWIGGADFAKEGKWYWITGEPFTYTNWRSSSSEPNNSEGIEHYAAICTNGWNDAPNDNAGNKTVFVCEYDEINTSGYEPSFEDEYNGHKYEYYDCSVDWVTAKTICETKGGHLVTIENTDENSRIKGHLSTLGKQVWIGYTDIENEGTWKDVLGNSVSFNNWDTTHKEPNNTIGIEDFAHMNMDGLWNDVPRFASMYVSMGFVCEYDGTSKILGDVNGDNTVNNTDLVLLRRYCAGNELPAFDSDVADFNNDNTINNTDLVLLRRYCAGNDIGDIGKEVVVNA